MTCIRLLEAKLVARIRMMIDFGAKDVDVTTEKYPPRFPAVLMPWVGGWPGAR